jgi:glutamate racemase
MKEDKIGIFDSGIGGLSVLSVLKELLPNEDYLYYADNKNLPYGDKNDDELFAISSNIIDYLIREHCKMIVIACNTMSTHCLAKLKEKYPYVPIVGTVPAIKIATDNDYKNVLVMATPATVESKRVEEILADNIKADENIIFLPCPGLATTIEKGNLDEIDHKLEELLEAYTGGNFDSVILGCTHYSLIKDDIQNMFPKAKLLDGCQGVANEVKKELTEKNLLNPKTTPSRTTFVNS